MKYIFWDFNGTILDDVNLCFNILNEMLETSGQKKITMSKYLDIFTFPIKDYYIKAGFDVNKNDFNILANSFINKYQKASLDLSLAPNVIEALEFFSQKGDVQVILSASKKSNLDEQVEHYKIKSYFQDILGIADIYATSKIDIAQKYILKNHINPKDITIIGDTLHDLEVAQKLGCECLLYTKGHQNKKRLLGNKLIDDFKELLK